MLQLLPVLALMATGCLAQDSSRPVGGRCSADGDCQSALRCEYGRCRPLCSFDRDCQTGAICVPSKDVPDLYVCTLPDEGGGSGCPAGLGDDGTSLCRRPCDPSTPDGENACGSLQICAQGWCRQTDVDDGAPDGGPPAGGDSGVDTAVTDGSSANDAAIFDGAAASDSDGGTGDGGAPTVLGTWVLIDVSGTPFTMGSPLTELGRFNDEVEHDVTLTRNYWLMATEITQQQYRDVMDYAPSNFSACGMDCPVERVSWHEVAAYANALSALEGLGECYSCTGTAPATIDCSPSGSYPTSYDCPGYRLPTEAEWEYAARGGTTTATYKGELTSVECDDTTLDPIAWFCGNANDTTHPAGTKEANGYGLYDMLGNVWEWCHNWYVRDGDDLELDPSGPASGNQRVIRGGAWDEKARRVRTAVRRRQGAGDRFPDVGGRLARSSP